MITVDDMVRREIRNCVSALVSVLAHGGCGIDSCTDEGGELKALAEQAAELCSPILDYEEAARQAGWQPNGPHGKWTNGNAGDGLYCSTNGDQVSCRNLCEDHNIDPYEREIFEHWVVSPWLADKLEAEGERVDKDFAGLCVWGRTTSGQGIAADSIIIKIHAGMVSA